MASINRALLSVFDKTGLSTLGHFLNERGVELLSTGGTLKALQAEGIPAIPIEEYTGSPEILDGRVKTLHPKIHGGLLARRDLVKDEQALRENNIKHIDLLVVNLYPFGQVIVRDNASLAEAIENIDIGGPTMLRSAAKNFAHTIVVCDPSDYERIMQKIQTEGVIEEQFRLELACKAFNHTASYDSMIADYLNKLTGKEFPQHLTLSYQKVQSLRYGENPHQKAAYYRPVIDIFRETQQKKPTVWRQLQGKELSYNNILDSNAALQTALVLPRPGVVIVKHLNPCGAAIIRQHNHVNAEQATDDELCDAFLRAYACDPVSSFGGIIAVQGTIGVNLAQAISKNFTEVIIAQAFSQEALQIFAQKKNIRLLLTDPSQSKPKPKAKEIRTALCGMLYQTTGNDNSDPKQWQIVTKREADAELLKAMHFAWCLCKQVRSNAIVMCSTESSLGIGAGQMSRLDSVELAVSKAAKAHLDLSQSVAASDAFFPFRDGIDALAKAGVKAVVQPGGSIRDKEVIAAADEHELVMAFTGIRHFLH